MRDKPNTPPPATTQAPPASSIFDPLLWERLPPAFGRYMAIAGGRIAGARNDALDYINRDVHEWQLRLGFRAPGSMTIRVPDAVECRKLTVKAASNWEEAVWIEPRRDERCYAWRADLDRRTTLPAAPAAHAGGELEPAARTEESMPESASAVEPEPTPSSPQAEPVSPGAETGQEESPPPDKPPDDDPTSGPEMRSRPPSDIELNGFVAGFIKNTTDAGRIPTKKGLYQAARDALPRATRKRLSDEFELQAETLPPGRPRKNRR
jgi:hypothetical protein